MPDWAVVLSTPNTGIEGVNDSQSGANSNSSQSNANSGGSQLSANSDDSHVLLIVAIIAVVGIGAYMYNKK